MKFTEYKSIGEALYETTLENGLKVFVVPKKDFDKKYAFFVTCYGGSDRRFMYKGQWVDTPAGIAHFLEHKMFETAQGNAIHELIGRGAAANAVTTPGMTAYHFECIDHFEENLKTLLSFVSVPYFTKESVDREQGIIGQEIRMIEGKPQNRIRSNLMKILYQHNPIREAVAGTVESIAKITPDTLYSCHEVFYNPANMALCLVGDMDPAAVVKLVEEILPKERGGPGERDYGPQESLLPIKCEIREKMQVAAPTFLYGCKVQPAPAGKARVLQMFTGNLALSLMSGSNSPLYASLYTAGLARGFSSRFTFYPDGANITFGAESGAMEKVLPLIKSAILDFIEKGPDEALFNRLKKTMTGGLITSMNSFSAIAGGLATSYFEGYNYFESLDLLHAIAAAEIQKFAKEHLVLERFALSVLEP